ncbi:MAG: molybdenum cofactor biosynthesis protein B [SAR324 cluster bacterium]|nr:molybdenum cofactor biosynthesis protein B [SAR324 cluster bacterium]
MDSGAVQVLTIAILTISDSRDETTDKSGALLVSMVTEAGHHVIEKRIVPDNIYQIRAVVSQWIADPRVQVVVTTGGTGVTGRDSTPEAVLPLLDRELEGFGELFRWLSYEEIKTSCMLSRAIAGVANKTYVFCLPGSAGACYTAWHKILKEQLNATHRPCNLAELIPRLDEHKHD